MVNGHYEVMKSQIVLLQMLKDTQKVRIRSRMGTVQSKDPSCNKLYLSPGG